MWSLLNALGGERTDQGVRRGPHAARQHHGQRGFGDTVERLSDRRRVGHDRQVVDAVEAPGERPGGRTGRQADCQIGTDQLERRTGDRVLLAALAFLLGDEAGLVRARVAESGGATVHLLDQSLLGELVEVASDRHLRDIEQFGEVADAHRTGSADCVDDDVVALVGKHGEM